MFVRYPPGRIRYEGGRPVALLGVRVPSSRFRLVDLPLGMPTTLARTGRGTWASYLLDECLFWLYQSDGLALFSRPGWWGSFRVPLDIPELAVVADRFHVTPLLPLLTGDGHFVEPLFLQAQRDAAARYDQLAGTVYALPSGEVPGGGSAAAVFRY